MNKRGLKKWLHWLVIYPLAGISALVIILFAAAIIGDLASDRGSGRMSTAVSRMKSDEPYYEYGYSRSTRERERYLAEQMKTWDSSYQLVPWEDLSATILRGDRPKSDYGCIYRDHKNCPGCYEPLMKIYYHNGWLTFCPNCRNQLKYKQEKQ